MLKHWTLIFSCKAFVISEVFRDFLFCSSSACHCRFSGESDKAMLFLMVQATQIMRLYGRRDHLMPSTIESEDWVECSSEPSVCVYEICE